MTKAEEDRQLGLLRAPQELAELADFGIIRENDDCMSAIMWDTTTGTCAQSA